MRRSNMHLLMFIILLLLLVGCRSIPIGGHAIIDWVDFIKWDGKMYYGIHSGVVSDGNFIGKKLGKVKFQVADNVTNSRYKIKDGDAAFHEKGTEIYRIKGNPDLLAVKDTRSINGYRIYYERDKYEYQWNFKNVPIEKVNAIEIYQGYVPNTKKITRINDKEKVNRFLKILKNSEEKPDFQPDTTKGDPTDYEMVLYTDEPIAYKYNMQFDGTTYFWYPWEPSILSEEIGAFIPN
ncbi:hypothetical protein J5Y03_10920 [Bacillus sp. RG28]|uniref:Uncharacterized protein n=1 Tax=Gottfriedia endophytica TaxID=2820819 RepID=A0A940NVI2_9BACI|nr:hypothetical protein [Gottfriedia endophytica]MBP0725683.1 hypothetical protein [Gottfriedia endophytica]